MKKQELFEMMAHEGIKFQKESREVERFLDGMMGFLVRLNSSTMEGEIVVSTGSKSVEYVVDGLKESKTTYDFMYWCGQAVRLLTADTLVH